MKKYLLVFKILGILIILGLLGLGCYKAYTGISGLFNKVQEWEGQLDKLEKLDGMYSKISSVEGMQEDYKKILENLEKEQTKLVKKKDFDYISQTVLELKEATFHSKVEESSDKIYEWHDDDGFYYINERLDLNLMTRDIEVGLSHKIQFTHILDIYPDRVESEIHHNIPDTHIGSFEFYQHRREHTKFWNYMSIPLALDLDWEEIENSTIYAGVKYKRHSVLKDLRKKRFMYQYELKFW